MDKETLSNYGWIVICVLVLSVMIALATPFGDYISTAVKSTTQGLFDTNKNALNSTGLINIGDQSFDDSASAPEIKREAGSVIPDGAKYTVKATNTVLEGNGTNKFPDTPATNDTYEEGDYKYTYNNGSEYYGTEWHVKVKDNSKTEYGEILSEIAGKPMTNMYSTFEGCESLTTAPAIPSSVTDIRVTFECCKSLTTAPAIPNSVTDMSFTFSQCPSLTTAPVIPNSVTNMRGTFANCPSLTTAPAIPSNVKSMQSAFNRCISLKGTIEINSNLGDYYSYAFCFADTSKPIVLTGTSTMLNELAATSSKGNITVAQ